MTRRAPSAGEAHAAASTPTGADSGVRRIELLLAVADVGPIHGTVRVAESDTAEEFWGVLDLMRILESVMPQPLGADGGTSGTGSLESRPGTDVSAPEPGPRT